MLYRRFHVIFAKIGNSFFLDFLRISLKRKCVIFFQISYKKFVKKPEVWIFSLKIFPLFVPIFYSKFSNFHFLEIFLEIFLENVSKNMGFFLNPFEIFIWFFDKILIFWQKIDLKNRLLPNFLIFDKIFHFVTKLGFLTNFQFCWQKFRFLTKMSIFYYQIDSKFSHDFLDLFWYFYKKILGYFAK